MTHPVLALGPDRPVMMALQLMHDRDIRHIPVVDDEAQLIGIVSDRDVRTIDVAALEIDKLETVRQEELQRHLTKPLADVMQPGVVTARVEDELVEAIRSMLEHRVGALPVVSDENHQVVGIVSYVDVLRAVLAELAA